MTVAPRARTPRLHSDPAGTTGQDKQLCAMSAGPMQASTNDGTMIGPSEAKMCPGHSGSAPGLPPNDGSAARLARNCSFFDTGMGFSPSVLPMSSGRVHKAASRRPSPGALRTVAS